MHLLRFHLGGYIIGNYLSGRDPSRPGRTLEGPSQDRPPPAAAAVDPTGRHPEMTTAPAPQPAPRGQPGDARQHLAAIAASLSGHGIPARLTRLAGIPVLTVDQPGAGPDRAAVSI